MRIFGRQQKETGFRAGRSEAAATIIWKIFTACDLSLRRL
jgi:hypothetical protein